MKHLLAIAIFFGSLAFGSYAQAENRCFMKTIRNQFHVLEGERAILIIGRGENYKVDARLCFDLRWAYEIDFITRPEGSRRVCRGDELVLIDATGRPYDRCRILDIETIAK